MPKFALLAGTLLLATPAFAQAAPTSLSESLSAPTTVDQAGAATSTDSALPATLVAKDAAAATQPITDTKQVAAVVDKEFTSYDKDGDGVLSAAEFDAWMVALKTATEPKTEASSPATKTWLDTAFAQADTDQNSKVSKTELTGFLSQPA
ncbi:EF-hand domain-containing protein [Sphingomonas sp. RB3P16]|uniref:EF-hand domain-containing protein n=1 Tax=Parasphingomonas frigoris TaxID=3096163 RepID=UPI002FCB4EE0